MRGMMAHGRVPSMFTSAQDTVERRLRTGPFRHVLVAVLGEGEEGGATTARW